MSIHNLLATDWFCLWKEIAQPAYYTVAICAAIGAVLTYRNNSRRERAKWVAQLYEKFYESNRYKTMRDKLDCPTDSDDVKTSVKNEDSEFTDYLNFFELVAFLIQTKQIHKSDVLKVFQYYLACLKRHPSVVQYVNNKANGFEQLRDLLNRTKL